MGNVKIFSAWCAAILTTISVTICLVSLNERLNPVIFYDCSDADQDSLKAYITKHYSENGHGFLMQEAKTIFCKPTLEKNLK